MNNTLRTILVWLVIGVVLTMVFMQVGNRQTSANVIDYSTFMDEARQGQVILRDPGYEPTVTRFDK